MKLHGAVIKTCMKLTNTECRVEKTPDDGQRSCPKHVEFYDRINLDNCCVCLVIKKKSVTTHGNMNVKIIGKPQDYICKVLNGANVDLMRIFTMYTYTKGLHTDEVGLRVSASKLLKNFRKYYCIFKGLY
jgi:hypothetical protein